MVGDGDLILIGAAGADIESRIPSIAERWRIGSIPATLADVAITSSTAPFVLLSMFAGGPRELTYYGNGATIQTDDRMALEFTAARAMYERPPNNAAAIQALRSDAHFPRAVTREMNAAGKQNWIARGAAGLKAEAFVMAYDSFRQAVALDSDNATALRGASDAAAAANRIADEVAWLQRLAAAEPANVAVRVELSHVLASRGDLDAAVAAATEANRLDPADPRPVEQLASIFLDAGDAEQLAPIADTLVSRFPERDDGRYYHAAALFLRGRPSEAADEARRLLNKNPRHARAQNLLGAACATAGQYECARTAFEAAIRLTPRDPSPYVNLGNLDLQTGNSSGAMNFFSEALALDPSSAAAREGLAQTRAALSSK